MAAQGGITDETCNYMLKLEVTSKSNTFNKIHLMQKKLTKQRQRKTLLERQNETHDDGLVTWGFLIGGIEKCKDEKDYPLCNRQEMVRGSNSKEVQ